MESAAIDSVEPELRHIGYIALKFLDIGHNIYLLNYFYINIMSSYKQDVDTITDLYTTFKYLNDMLYLV